MIMCSNRCFIQLLFGQITHSSHGHSGITSRGGMSVVGNQGYNSSTNGVGGSIPGILPTSAAIGNRSSVPSLGVSPILGNTGPRLTGSVGNIVGGGNIGRSMSSGGGLSLPGLASRLGGSGNLNVQGPNRLILPQGKRLHYLQDSLLSFLITFI